MQFGFSLRVFAFLREDMLTNQTFVRFVSFVVKQSKSLGTIDTNGATSIRYGTTISGGLSWNHCRAAPIFNER